MAKQLMILIALAGCWVGGAQATLFQYRAALGGAAENPVNSSPGTGTTLVAYDSAAQTLLVDVVFSGLLGTSTNAHIHCCVDAPGNVGVATTLPTFTGFPSGVSFGHYRHLFDLTLPTSFNPAFVTANGGTTSGATSALIAGLDTGRAYLNIHSTQFGGGEIRGFLALPEPGTILLLGLGIGVVGWRRPAASTHRP